MTETYPPPSPRRKTVSKPDRVTIYQATRYPITRLIVADSHAEAIELFKADQGSEPDYVTIYTDCGLIKHGMRGMR